VGTEVSVRTCCVHLPTACENTARKFLQNIHNYVPHSNPDSIMNPHLLEHLKSYAKEYQTLRHEWERYIGKTEIQKSRMYCTDTVFNIRYSFQQLCMQCFWFCLSNKLRKRVLKHFLVSSIISTNTHFRAWNT